MKRLFSKEYIIKLEETNLDFEYLEIENIEEIYDLEMEAFSISSLGYFNQVIAKFEKTDSNHKVLLKLELPKRSLYLQIIPICFFLLLGVFIIISGEYKEKKSSEYFTYSIPLIIIFMGYTYQKDFLKESEIFLKDIMDN